MSPQSDNYKKSGPPDHRAGMGEPPVRRRSPRGLLFFVIFSTLIFVLIYYGLRSFAPDVSLITFGELQKEVQANRIKNVLIKGNRAEGEYKIGGQHRYFKTTTILENDLDKKTIEELRNIVGPENFDTQEFNPWLQPLLINLLPWLLIFGVIWYFFFRQIKTSSGPGGIFSFGKSTARFASRDQRKVTFDDVAGIDESKEEVEEIIEFLKNPKQFQRLGARIPRGVLLVGPPGTGKTLLAKAIAGEANVPFLSMSGSDFVEMFVGVGASRVRDLFRQAKENSPCIIFLDEIDAVGRHRGSGLGGGHDEREQTLNAILVEMDGFTTDTSVILMAATNRPDVLDPALLRPGRFDRQIVLDMPDLKGREAILKVHARKVKMVENIDLTTLAKTTPLFSGPDLDAVINEAGLLAVM